MHLNKIKLFIIIIIIILNNALFLKYRNKKRIGVVGLEHSINIGNNLLKYAIYIIISKFLYYNESK